MRLNIAQDAFCQHRPKPRKLFRDLPYPRDLTSWCEDRSWHAKHGFRRDPICSDCAHALATYRAANKGAEPTLDEAPEETRFPQIRRNSNNGSNERAPEARNAQMRHNLCPPSY